VDQDIVFCEDYPWLSAMKEITLSSIKFFTLVVSLVHFFVTRVADLRAIIVTWLSGQHSCQDGKKLSTAGNKLMARTLSKTPEVSSEGQVRPAIFKPHAATTQNEETSARVLTQRLTSAKSLESALMELERALASGTTFNHFHATAMLCLLAHRSHEMPMRANALCGYDVAANAICKLYEKEDLNEGTLCCAFWAISTLYHKVPELHGVLPLINRSLAPRVDDLNSRHVQSCMWAIATLRKEQPTLRQLLPSLLRRLEIVASSMDSRDLSYCMWSMGVLKLDEMQSRGAAEALQDASCRMLSVFGTRELAQLSWLMASFGTPHTMALLRIPTLVCQKIAKATDRMATLDLTQIALAYAVLEFWNHAMMQAIAERIKKINNNLTDWGVCALADAFGTFYPSTSSGFTGTWGVTGGENETSTRGIIYGNLLELNTRDQAELVFIGDRCCEVSKRKGKSITGTLNEMALSITWSNGEVWTRSRPAFANFQNFLSWELRRRGLTSKVKWARRGPERYLDDVNA